MAEASPIRRRRNAVERFFARLLIGMGGIEQTFRRLVILLKGDVGVAAALETCAELAKSDLRLALYETAAEIRDGRSFARALEISMPWIGDIFIGLVEVGEANGSLPQMFEYAADILEQRRKIRSQIIRAMTYPLLVVFMGLGVGCYVSTVAIPKIVSVMGSPEKLPEITKSLLTVSAWLETNGIWVMASPLLAIAAYMIARRIPRLGPVVDRISLYVPVFGKVGRYSANAIFNHTSSMLIASGIPVVDALELVSGTLSNSCYRRELAAVREKVSSGSMFSEAMRATSLRRLTPLTPALLKVGESSGGMDEGLRYAGDYYSAMLERRLDLLGKLVEPALIVVVGSMVAYVYIAFFMGMAAMNTAAR